MLANEDVLITAATTAGLIVPRQAWHAQHTDEDGEVWYTVHETKAEAVREIEDEEDPLPVVPARTWVATPALHRRWAKDFTVKLDPIGDFAAQMAMLYVTEDTQLDVDGAWWNEDLDVYKLSAPRGVIFRSRLGAWCADEVDWADAPDGEEEAR
jgi:hypothetical protein